MAALSQATRAVGSAFPNQGLSLWHSIGEVAGQEVRHLHFHVHPHFLGDGVLRIYPETPATPDKAVRDRYAAVVREHLR